MASALVKQVGSLLGAGIAPRDIQVRLHLTGQHLKEIINENFPDWYMRDAHCLNCGFTVDVDVQRGQVQRCPECGTVNLKVG